MDFNIESIKRKMLVKYPFFGSVVANVDYKPNKNMPTAGTDGKTIYYNPNFLSKLDVDEQTFVFSHEVCHIAFNHILRSEGKNTYVWNKATDAVINAFLKKDGLKITAGGVDIADAINYDAEQLYEKLLKEENQQNQSQQGQSGQDSQGQQENESQSQQSQSGSEKNQQNQSQQGQSGQGSQGQQENESQSQQSQGGSEKNQESQSQDPQQQNDQNNNQSTGGSSSNFDSQEENDNNSRSNGSSSQDENQDVGHDTHSMWSEAVKKHKEEQKKKDKEEKPEKEDIKNKNDNLERKNRKNEIEKKQDETEQLGEKESFKKNIEEKKRELEELKRALSQQAMGAGSFTNRDVRNIVDIGRSKPIIDWRYVLREAIKYDVDWSYKNATIEDGVISANLEEQPMPETEIVIDTSGSINEILLKNFLRECKNILQHSRLKVGCFDTKFYGFHEIRTEDDIENMKFEGGGGTDFTVAVGAFTRRVENKIIFTDGDARMPNMPLDAIWIVFGGIRINPPGGKVIQIDNEQLDKLYSYQLNNSYKGRIR